MRDVSAGIGTKSVPRLSNLEELFASVAAWKLEGMHSRLFDYLQKTWRPKSRRRPLTNPMQRAEEALKLLRRWNLVDADGNPETTCLELADQFETDRLLFWTSLARLVLERDYVFRGIHNALLSQPLTKRQIAQLWNPVTADVCISWGRAFRLFYNRYEEKRSFFAVRLGAPQEREARETVEKCYARLSTDSLGTRTEYVRIPALVNCASFMLKVGEDHFRAELVRWARESPFSIEFASAPRVSIERKGGVTITFDGRTYY